MRLTLYLVTGRSDLIGGNHLMVTVIFPPAIKVSPSVRFVGGPGLRGSERNREQEHEDIGAKQISKQPTGDRC